MTLIMNLFSYLKKLFFMGTTHTTPRFIAKRKYWIEWHLLFDKYPSKDYKDLDAIRDDLKKYIENYLNKYFEKNHNEKKPGTKSASGAMYATSELPKQLVEFVNDFFGWDPASKSKQDATDPFFEYFKWEKNDWVLTDSKDYEAIVGKNLDATKPENKQALYYNAYTKYWMKLFKCDWIEVSGSQYVFSFVGWFEGKNNIRLSDAGAENRGTMNPPSPPPPPAV
jgi:hypothetical protein